MDAVAGMAPRDRSDLFRAAAERKGVSVQIIEKDFWVCWTLRQLFALEGLPARLCFKGGTSLSKVFKVIERMSEDIDLVIDRSDLGFGPDAELEQASGKERDRRIRALKESAATMVSGPLSAALHARMSAVLGPPPAWSLKTDTSDPDNSLVQFRYPTLEPGSAYLRPTVQLELGARGDTHPAALGAVTPYAAEELPGKFVQPTAAVRALSAERTFWEKATLLHALVHHDAEWAVRAKPARHFYDLYRLWQHGIGPAAVENRGLLAEVIRHKLLFYRDPRARYELALCGQMRLVPGAEILTSLEPDYAAMTEEMVFGPAPPLQEVLSVLALIEARANRPTP